MNRFRFSIRTLLLIVISILNFLIAVPLGVMTYRAYDDFRSARETETITSAVHDLYNLKKNLSIERAAAYSALFLPPDSYETLYRQMKETRHKGDMIWRRVADDLASFRTKEVQDALESVKISALAMRKIRIEFDTAAGRSTADNITLANRYFQHVTQMMTQLDTLIEAYARNIDSADVMRQIRQTRLIWEVSEYAGQEYAMLGQLIARSQYPDAETAERLRSLRERIRYGLELARSAFAASAWRQELLGPLDEAQTHYFMIFEQTKTIFDRPDSEGEAPYAMPVEMWLQLASEAVNSLHGMTDGVLQVNTRYVNDVKNRTRQSILLSASLFISALLLSFYTLWLIHTRVIHPVNRMIEALYEETRLSQTNIDAQTSLDEITKLGQVLDVFRANSRQLEKERDRAQIASIAKSEFLANMSHEIRTPMNVVVGLSSILARSKPLTDKQAEFIKTLQISAESLLSLINDLLDFSKIEAESFELEETRFDLAKLVDDLKIVKTFRAQEKGLGFITRVQGLEGKDYIGDPTRIRQILVNLCGNAIKFTERGSVTLTVAAEQAPQPDYDMIRIAVTDTGIGIPADKIGSIFEKFTQADASIVRKYGGTGLGLAITKSLVEMMDGTIDVTSLPGEGATFTVSFPLLRRAQARIFAHDAQAPTPPRPVTQGRVLVVEDYYPNAIVAGTFLDEFGYEYDIAENGQAAITKYMEGDYCAVLMDVQMPKMDGYQTTQAIREFEKEHRRPRVRIIGLTAHASVNDRERCLAAGMDAYLSKPFNQRQLRQALDGGETATKN